jgi:hypothetical protein
MNFGIPQNVYGQPRKIALPQFKFCIKRHGRQDASVKECKCRVSRSVHPNIDITILWHVAGHCNPKKLVSFCLHLGILEDRGRRRS